MNSLRPKASIVIPAYNTEEYIERALSCAANQTEIDIQVIVVDDGSDDDTLRVAQEFAAKDSRFEVIHVENGGVSRARNIGLEHVRGEKLFFLDSDDEFDARLVEKCLAFGRANDVSAVLYGYSNQTEAGKGVPFSHELEAVYRGAEIRERLTPHFIGHSYADVNDWIRGRKGMRQGKEHTALWRIMLDTDVVRTAGLRFNEALDLGEDTIFMNTYLLAEESVGFLDECLYWLTAREGSLNWSSNHDLARMARNKLKLVREKERLAAKVLDSEGFDLAPLYTGTQVLSALQLCLGLGRNRTMANNDKRRVLESYLDDAAVRHDIAAFTPPLALRAIPFFALKACGGVPIMRAISVAARLGLAR